MKSYLCFRMTLYIHSYQLTCALNHRGFLLTPMRTVVLSTVDEGNAVTCAFFMYSSLKLLLLFVISQLYHLWWIKIFKSRDLTSRDRTTRDQVARVDIARHNYTRTRSSRDGHFLLHGTLYELHHCLLRHVHDKQGIPQPYLMTRA